MLEHVSPGQQWERISVFTLLPDAVRMSNINSSVSRLQQSMHNELIALPWVFLSKLCHHDLHIKHGQFLPEHFHPRVGDQETVGVVRLL
jgi:hypothetical protein